MNEKLPVCIQSCELLDSLREVDLVQQIQIHLATFGACVCHTGASGAHGEDLDRWKASIKFLGGSLSPGLPNSPKLGIQRANGMPYSPFARGIRNNRYVRQFWHLACLASGRISPWANTEFAQTVLTSFDGTLVTPKRHRKFVRGIQPHVDKYTDEPGQLQAIVYVSPPPRGYLRLAQAVCYYPASGGENQDLRRDFLVALLSRNATSPDCDSRFSPKPSLGSSKATMKQRKVFGGVYFTKAEVVKLTLDELEMKALALDKSMQALVPKRIVGEPPVTLVQFLINNQVQPIDLKRFQQAKTAALMNDSRTGVRSLYVRAVVAGLNPSSRSNACQGMSSYKMLEDGEWAIAPRA
jgi:hypothetical protein